VPWDARRISVSGRCAKYRHSIIVPRDPIPALPKETRTKFRAAPAAPLGPFHRLHMLKDVELHGRDWNDCCGELPARARLNSVRLDELGTQTIMPSPGGWKLHASKIESASLQRIGRASGSREEQLPAKACH